MSYAERHTVTVTTNASGDATEYTPVVTGRVQTIIYTKTDYATDPDFTVTVEGTAEQLWREDDVDASTVRAPRQPTHDGLGAASLYAGSGEPVEGHIVVADDRVKVVVANGGNAKTGTFDVVIA